MWQTSGTLARRTLVENLWLSIFQTIKEIWGNILYNMFSFIDDKGLAAGRNIFVYIKLKFKIFRIFCFIYSVKCSTSYESYPYHMNHMRLIILELKLTLRIGKCIFCFMHHMVILELCIIRTII